MSPQDALDHAPAEPRPVTNDGMTVSHGGPTLEYLAPPVVRLRRSRPEVTKHDQGSNEVHASKRLPLAVDKGRD